MEKLLDVNFNWVSLNSFESVVKEDLSKVGSHFTKEDLIKDNSQKTILPKLRNILKFCCLIGILDTNGKYQKSQHNRVQEYFSYMNQGLIKQARELLSAFISSSPHFKEILEFLRMPNISRRDFIEFLKNKDNNQFEESRYKTMAMVLSNMLFELKLVNKVRTKGGRIKKQRGTQIPLIDISIEKSNLNAQEPNNKSLGYALLGEALRRLTIEEIKQYFEDIEKIKRL